MCVSVHTDTQTHKPSRSRRSKLHRPNKKQRNVSLTLPYLQPPHSLSLLPNTTKTTSFVTRQRAPLQSFFFSCLKTSCAGNSLEETFFTNPEDETGRSRVPVGSMCSVSILSTVHSQLELQPNGRASFLFLTSLNPVPAHTCTA